jgi:curved DNA-binding protein CbpA
MDRAMSDLDPWAELGVGHEASAAEVQQAWRRKAQEHHPDRGGDAARFDRARRAWTILGDPELRRRWEAGERVEPGPEQHPDALAHQLITETVMRVLMTEAEPSGDVIAAMVGAIEESARTLEAALQGADQKIGRAERLLARSRRKRRAEEDIVGRTLRWHLGEIRRARGTAEQQLRIVRRAQEILRDHELMMGTGQPMRTDQYRFVQGMYGS